MKEFLKMPIMDKYTRSYNNDGGVSISDLDEIIYCLNRCISELEKTTTDKSTMGSFFAVYKEALFKIVTLPLSVKLTLHYFYPRKWWDDKSKKRISILLTIITICDFSDSEMLFEVQPKNFIDGTRKKIQEALDGFIIIRENIELFTEEIRFWPNRIGMLPLLITRDVYCFCCNAKLKEGEVRIVDDSRYLCYINNQNNYRVESPSFFLEGNYALAFHCRFCDEFLKIMKDKIDNIYESSLWMFFWIGPVVIYFIVKYNALKTFEQWIKTTSLSIIIFGVILLTLYHLRKMAVRSLLNVIVIYYKGQFFPRGEEIKNVAIVNKSNLSNFLLFLRRVFNEKNTVSNLGMEYYKKKN